MVVVGWRLWAGPALLGAGVLALLAAKAPRAGAQEQLPVPSPLQAAAGGVAVPPPALPAPDRPLPINLPTALQLAGVRPLDIAAASQQLQVAAAQLKQAQVLWLPSVYLGTDYARHDGTFQDSATGAIDSNSRGSFMYGVGPSAVFALSDAIFAPLAARQTLRARQSALQTARNDSLLAVAQAYFNVQQARGNLAAAQDVSRRIEALYGTAQKQQSAGLVRELDVVRARAALDASRLALQTVREQWRVASAELVRLLRLDASAVVEPLEPPQLRVTLVATDQPVDELIRVGLTNRPELASHQALVQATLEQLRQEKLRPWIPSVLLRGFSTPVTGTYMAGPFGGGPNGQIGSFGGRLDLDLQIAWEFQNLGLGNFGLVQQRRAENAAALVELFRTQDQVAADVAKALAQAQSAAARLREADVEVRDATESANKNLEALGQTKTQGPKDAPVLVLVVTPLETIIAVQALGQAYTDYFTAVADYDRAQFLLYHALGQPAQAVTQGDGTCAVLPTAGPVRATLGTPVSVTAEPEP
jgi:outer membrane protein TolC